MRRSRVTATLGLAGAVLLAGCGEATRTSPPIGTVAPAPSSTVVEPGDLLVGQGILMQKTATSPVELCVGAVAESYPPQCGGPRIVGDVDWDALAPERASGVTWTKDTIWAVGRLDLDSGGSGDSGSSGDARDSGTFTLDRPLSLTPPAGFEAPTEEPMTFPQLCDDPYAGGGSEGGGSPEAQNSLTEALERLDGYVASWVSDGSSMFNVLVTGDPDQALTELRKVWKGGLCVEQRDLPTQADLRAAQDAVTNEVDGLLSSGGGGVDGRLEVQVTVLDSATRDRVLEAVSPWLEPADVRFTSAFQPLPR